MKRGFLHFAPARGRSLTAALAGAAMLASAVSAPAGYQVEGVPAAEPSLGEYQVAAADCYGVGQQVAAQYGGELAKASASNQGGQEVCVIVVLVPGKDGQRPRRVQVVVPAG